MEFIENPISNKLQKAEMTTQEIKEAKNELLRLSANDKERMKYEDRRAALLDKVSALENAEEKGIEIGKEIGKKEGEKNKAIEVAKNSLKAGRMGNPVIFAYKYYEELKKLEGDVGGKCVLKKHLDDVQMFEMSASELKDLDSLTEIHE